MTNPRLLIPLRVPEIGPSLGRLVTGTGRRPGGLALDAARVRLVTRLFDAAGEARRLAANGERDAALTALGRRVWLDAWEDAVGSVAALLVEQIAARLDRAAVAARMPPRRRRAHRLEEGESGAVTARLGSAGAGLVPVLDRLEAAAERLRGATALERDALTTWQEALLTAGRRLEAAWVMLEERADAELAHWDTVAAEIAGWRPSLWPVVAAAVPALAAAVWLGLILGGWLPAPAWLQAAWQSVRP